MTIQKKAEPTNHMKVSVCMATYNRPPAVLGRVFESIFRQKPPFDFEVIVCDDGTPNHAVEQLAKAYPIQYHRINRPPGFLNPCVPRNVTYRAAKGDIIIAQSDEVVHQDGDTMETLVSELEAQPGKFIIATVLACGPDGKPWSVYSGTKRQKPWFFLGALWRKHLYQIGGNDEDFRGGPSFDDEWFARCLQKGLGLTPFYSTAAVGHHLYHPPSSSKETGRPNREIGERKTEEAERTGVWCASGGPWPMPGEAPAFTSHPSNERITSLVVCVEYDDFLSISLPRNKRHFDRTIVITSSADTATQEVARREGCECFITDAFYARGARFNKGLAIEQAFAALGREGWLCYWDADIVMPDECPFGRDTRFLYSPFRRILEDPAQFSDTLDWSTLARNPMESEFPGYLHLFHAEEAGLPPWYSTHWKHAGGCDSDFEALYRAKDALRRPGFEVLHLGGVTPPVANQAITRVGRNWCGRSTPRLDTGQSPEKADTRSKQVSAMIDTRRTQGVAGLSGERDGNIPRRMSFLWSRRMSWLRWLSLETFTKLNPNWDVRLYMPTTSTPVQDWPGITDDHEYTGPDYRDQLPGKVTRHTFDPPAGVAAPQLCGWFRWQVLSRGGGFFADMDFVWLKPLDDIWRAVRDANAMFCLESGYLAVGFMASCPNCPLFQDIAAFLPPHASSQHQHYGVDGLYRFTEVDRTGTPPGKRAMAAIRRRYGKQTIVEVPDSTVYPYDWRQIDTIWTGNEPVSEKAVALHWFGGAKASRTHSHRLTADNWKEGQNTIRNYLERVL